MPDVPLYSRPAHPDASHGVIAPGGYEWWYFDAEDAEQDVQVVGILLDGFPFHPGYLRRHAAYLRRPTKVKPAVPGEYPCAYLAVYEKGKLVTQFMSQYAAGSLRASGQAPEVRVGPNGFDGNAMELEGHPWRLTGRGPVTESDGRLAMKMELTPRLESRPVERVFLSREMTGAEHHWVLASPLNGFRATVTQTGARPRSWSLKGLAYHDHNFGTGPLGPGLKHWMWGRVLTEGACHTFHYATPRDGRLKPESHLIVATLSATTVSEVPPEIVFDRRSALGLAYPSRVKFETGLTLGEPVVVDNTPFYLRLKYKARLPDGTAGVALTEVAVPRRLRWPVLGRMIEMSINRRPPESPG